MGHIYLFFFLEEQLITGDNALTFQGLIYLIVYLFVIDTC